MKQIRKRLLSLALAAMMALSVLPTAYAADGGDVTLTYKQPAGAVGEAYTTPAVPSGTETLVVPYSFIVDIAGKAWEVPEGKAFQCWTDGTNFYSPGDKITLNSNVELEAVYVDAGENPPSAAVTITYQQSASAVGDPFASSEMVAGTKVEVLDYATVSNGAILTDGAAWTIPEGKQFYTWTDGQSNFFPGDEIVCDSSKILTPVYVDAPEVAVVAPDLFGTAGELMWLVAVEAPEGTFASEDLPAGLTMDAKTGTISGTPAAAGSGKYHVTFTPATGDPITVEGSYEFVEQNTVLKVAEKKLADRSSGANIRPGNGQFTFTVTPMFHHNDTQGGLCYTLGNAADVFEVASKADGSISLPMSVFTADLCTKYGYNSLGGNEIFDAAYMFLISEKDDGEDGFTYDAASYFINIVYLDGTLQIVSAQKFRQDGDKFLTESMADTLYAVTDNPVLEGLGEKGYVPFENTFTAEPPVEPAVTYTVRYDSNGGSGSMSGSNSPYEVGATVTVLPNGFTRSGYTFTGWNTKADGTGDSYAANGTFTMPGNDVTLYAQWSYNGGGSGSGGSGGGGGGGSSSSSRPTLHFDSNAGDKIDSLTKPSGTVIDLSKYIPTREGYVFEGWYADEDLTQHITSITLKKDTTVYAKWSKAPVEDKPQGELNTDEHILYVVGYPDGTVRPNSNILRSEVVTMFYRLLTHERRSEIYTTRNSFSDMSSGMWCNKAVSSMAAGGYITGYVDGTFGPDRSITRAEFVAIAARFAGAESAGVSFNDVTSNYWAYSAISTAAAKGWITGYSDGSFRPDQYITRAEAMAIINRMLGRGVDANGLTDGYKVWPDNEPGAWYYYEVIEATNDHAHKGARPSEEWTGFTIDYEYDREHFEMP